MEATMQTDTPTDATQSESQIQSHSLIASDRVEGTPVRRSDGSKVGTVQRLMIDKLTGNVAYAVLRFGGFLGMGRNTCRFHGYGSAMIARSAPIRSTSPTRNCGAHPPLVPTRSSTGATAVRRSRSTTTTRRRPIGAPISPGVL